MKKPTILIFIALISFTINIYAQENYWIESFEQTVWPTSSSTTETNVYANTGIWKVYAGYRTTSYKNTGVASLQLTTNSYFITPLVNKGIKSISFYSRSTGSARPLSILKTTDGTSFTEVTTGNSGTSTGFVISTYSINDSTAKAIKILVVSGGTAIFDDVTLTSMIKPTINVSSSSLPYFGIHEIGDTSTSQIYTVSGTDLTANVTIDAPTNFLISNDNITYSSSITLSPTAGTLYSTTIYVRFLPTSAGGNINSEITHTSTGADIKKVGVHGIAIAKEPTIAPTISFGQVTGSSIVVNFESGNGDGRIVVAKKNSAVSWQPTDGTSFNGISNDFSAAIEQEDGNKVVYAGNGNSVTITGLAVGTTYHFAVYEYSGTVKNSENYLTSSYAFGSQATVAEPGLSVNQSVIAFGNVIATQSSEIKSYQLSGAFLTPAEGTIVINAPNRYSVSLSSNGEFTSSLNIPYSGATLEATNIYVKFSPDSTKTYNGVISHTGGGASALNVIVSGNGLDSTLINVKTYFVSPSGNDSNPGTIDAPFYNISAAVALVKAGDTIYVRGGKYSYNTTIILSASGTSAKKICLFAYPGEFPELDFSTQPYGASYRAFLLTGNYWYIKGLEIHHAGDNGIKVEGNYNRIELCVLHHNGDTGIQLGFGHIFSDSHPGISSNDGTYCAYNYIYNCDSYYNYDSDSNGGDADGFACKMHNGIGNVFRGCRAWYNSDDGWDLFETDFAVIIDSCWTWKSGIGQGNGNGFKLGGDGTGGSSKGTHVVTNGVAFGHKVNGFTNNSHKDGELIVNCLSFSNGTSGYNYYFEGSLNTGKANTFKNNVGIPRSGTSGNFTYDVTPIEFNNSWNLPVTPNTADYVDLSEAAAMAPRQADGSLPTGFARLVAGSDLIDKGVDVGLPFYGSAPDLGPFEYIPPSNVEVVFENIPQSYLIVHNFPNPFNPTTNIRFIIENNGLVKLNIFDILGRELATLINDVKSAGIYSIQWNAKNLPSGVYFAVLQTQGKTFTHKMLLAK